MIALLFLIKSVRLIESERLDHRPRKSLDYRTPFEVFYSDPSDTVALQI
jgi:IS30 family transposase